MEVAKPSELNDSIKQNEALDDLLNEDVQVEAADEPSVSVPKSDNEKSKEKSIDDKHLST